MPGWKLAGTNIGSDTQFTTGTEAEALRGSKWRLASDKQMEPSQEGAPIPSQQSKDEKIELSTELKYSKDQLEMMSRDHLQTVAAGRGILNPKQPKEKLIEFILEKQS